MTVNMKKSIWPCTLALGLCVLLSSCSDSETEQGEEKGGSGAISATNTGEAGQYHTSAANGGKNEVGSSSVGILHLPGSHVFRGCHCGLASSGLGRHRSADHEKRQGSAVLCRKSHSGLLFRRNHVAADHGSPGHMHSKRARDPGDAE